MATTKALPCLPTEIIEIKILPRLPARSLLRFKCVCKSWYRYTSSPEFSTLQLCLSPRTESEGLLIFPYQLSVDELYYRDLNSPSPRVAKLPFPGHCNQRIITIVGSCNGLLCVADLHELLVFNPLITSYSREIPLDYHTDSYHLPELHDRFGFGYDSVADDYKIVRVLHKEFSPPRPRRGDRIIPVTHRHEGVWVATVYSLRNDSWRMVKGAVPHGEGRICFISAFGGVTIDIHLVHWIMIHKNLNSYHIVRFDLMSENWIDDVPLPCSYAKLTYRSDDVINLAVLDGCLSLSTKIKSRGCDQENGVSVWIMKEYGVKESWVNLLHISSTAFPAVISPIMYGKRSERGEVLLQQEKCRSTAMYVWSSYERANQLVWYDFGDGSIKRAKMCGLSDNLKVCLHRATLVNVCSSPNKKRAAKHRSKVQHKNK